MTVYAVQRYSMEEEARRILEECRVAAPGVMALSGFQLLAIFNTVFHETLSGGARLLHLGSMGLVLIALFLLLTPAAYHRLAEPCVASAHFVESAARLLGWAMAFLRLGLVVEAYVAARALGLAHSSGAALSAGLFLVSWTLWSVYPRVSVLRLAPHTKSD